MDFSSRLQFIHSRLASAAHRVGRDPAGITLLAVTKTIPAEVVQTALDLGITHLGENRVQEAREKFPLLRGQFTRHLIGHLQTNKAKLAAELFDVVHSVDSLRIAEALEQACAAINKTLKIFVEVNLSHEATKFGVRAEELPTLTTEIKKISHLKLTGLMTIPPPVENPEANRPYFRQLKKLAEEFNLRELSMGMSGDFEVAIEEGATIVRVGTGIFGERKN